MNQDAPRTQAPRRLTRSSRERMWAGVAGGLGEYFEIEPEETYGEFFDIPAPEQLVFVSWFKGGEVFRSGCCYHRGRGKVFYFQPGHETHPTYFNPQVLQVIANAVRWAAPVDAAQPQRGRSEPLEPIR